jgi:putative membrane protein
MTGEEHVKRLSSLINVTAIIYCCSLLPGFSQTTQDQTQTTFLAKAIESNAAEVELGKMAESKTQNPRVRAYAQMMVKDHTSTLDALHRLVTGGVSALANDSSGADTAQLTARVPLSKEHQELKDRLSRLSGDDFDREYMNAMVQEHRRDIREFEREANSTTNTEDTSGVRQKPQPRADSTGTSTMTQERIIARDLLPVLKMHLQQAEALDREVGAGGIPNNSWGGQEHGAHIKTQ